MSQTLKLQQPKLSSPKIAKHALLRIYVRCPTEPLNAQKVGTNVPSNERSARGQTQHPHRSVISRSSARRSVLTTNRDFPTVMDVPRVIMLLINIFTVI